LALLDVQDPDLDGAALEAGNGPPGVEPFMAQDVLRVKGGDILENPLVDALHVLPAAGNPLRDDQAGDGRNPCLVVP